MTEKAETVRKWIEGQKNWCDHGQIWTNENIHNFANALLDWVEENWDYFYSPAENFARLRGGKGKDGL